MADSISNRDDVIDSRNVIERIEELETERQDLADALQEAIDAKDEDDGTDQDKADQLTDAVGDARESLQAWDEGDESEELKALKSLADQAEGYSGDWIHGAALIRDSHFENYAREMAEDLHGDKMRAAEWPFSCIDWEKAASDLRMDYTSVDFDGVDYWVR